jgi:tRNA threonylcarbamoyladenosine biosynthesis protein TsaB
MTIKILAIDTSTEACSAALLCDGQMHERYQLAPREHGRLILKMIDEVLSDAGLSLKQLDALAFGRGPGAFTGVRIATGVIQGLAFGADLPVVPVSSLAALAQGAARQHGATRVLAALDARMGEIYWGVYQSDAAGLMVEVEVERVCPAQMIETPAGMGWFGVGSGFAAYAEILRERLGAALAGCAPDAYPQARDVAVLGAAAFARGEAVSAEQALPVYLRDNVVQTRASSADRT